MKEQLELLSNKDWFHSIGTDEYGRHVVYIKYTTSETLNDIPDSINGKQVMVHFAASVIANKEKYINVLNSRKPLLEEAEEQPLDLATLSSELSELKEICGLDDLQNVFYESHDQNNAVTDLSAKYPEVRKAMDRLYDQFGFDLLHEELEIY